MRADQLRQQLEHSYDLVVFEDLAALRVKHRAVFDLFRAAWKERYDPNQRLVLYSAHTPELDFLLHIQRAAARIDISNFFILIVCPTDIRSQLCEANEKFGHDESVIPSMIQPLIDTEPFGPAKFVVSNSLCPLPFAQLDVGQYGHSNPCCKFERQIPNPDPSPIATFFGDTLSRVRQQMIDDQKPVECRTCWHIEQSGSTSLRQLARLKYMDQLDRGWLDDLQIRDLTIAPTSLCNFRCRICNPKSSSSIAVEELQHSTSHEYKDQLKSIIKLGTKGVSASLVTELAKLPHLEYLHVLGGEPLLWPQFNYLLDELITVGRTCSMGIEINTNCSVYPKDLLARMIDHFRSLEILLSLDNVGARFELERGGNWSEIQSNVQKFSQLQSSKVKVKLAVTINLQNVLYLDDIIHFAQASNLSILWWYLEKPQHLCIEQATPRLQRMIAHLYQNHADLELRAMAQRVTQAPGSDGQQFLQHMSQLDHRRQQRFDVTHKEVYEAMGGCMIPEHNL